MYYNPEEHLCSVLETTAEIPHIVPAPSVNPHNAARSNTMHMYRLGPKSYI